MLSCLQVLTKADPGGALAKQGGSFRATAQKAAIPASGAWIETFQNLVRGGAIGSGFRWAHGFTSRDSRKTRATELHVISGFVKLFSPLIPPN